MHLFDFKVNFFLKYSAAEKGTFKEGLLKQYCEQNMLFSSCLIINSYYLQKVFIINKFVIK